MKGYVQLQEHSQLTDISRSNGFKNNFIGSMNQEVKASGGHSYGNEVHNEGMFIRDSNVETFTPELIERTSKYQYK